MAFGWKRLPVQTAGDALVVELNKRGDTLQAAFDPQRVSVSGILNLRQAFTLALVDTTAADVVVSLPDATEFDRALVRVKKIASGHTLTVASDSLIDNAATKAWSTNLQAFDFCAVGGRWWVF